MFYLRLFWVQLTSMRTALLLLFTLAVVAIPGSLLPQRPVSPIRVADWKAANPSVAGFYESIGLFDVYHSPWFAAVYLLLMVSLVGCIVPRIGIYFRALRTPPPRAPSHFHRLPASASGITTMAADEALTAGAALLRRKRFRVRCDGETVAAERGYLRELGNLLFHLSFVIMLVGLGWNSLWGYKGEVITVEGQAFSNSLTQYDDFTAGPAFKPENLVPFTVWVDKFTAKFETGQVQRGAARVFKADVRVASGDATPQAAAIEVNHPLDVAGAQIHIVGHGYAPVVSVTDPTGHIAFSGPVPFLPQDSNFTSMGVVKVPDARPRYLGFEGFFLPTAVVDDRGPRSVFPDALQPEMFLTVWTGPPRKETGRPESVYSLAKNDLTQLKAADGTPVAFRISPGQIVDLPDGSKLSFDDWRRWTKLQVSYEPGLWLVIAAVLLAVAGVSASLYVRPRRLWLRVGRDAEGGCRVEVGGLDRAEAATGLADDVAALLAAAGANGSRVDSLCQNPSQTQGFPR